MLATPSTHAVTKATHKQISTGLGIARLTAGTKVAATMPVKRAIEMNPENPDALYLIGFILGDLGRSEEAAEANRRAVAWIEQNLTPLLAGNASASAGPVIVHTLA